MPSSTEVVEVAAKALAEAASGGLRPVIGGTFPLSCAREAHAAIEGGRCEESLLTTRAFDGRGDVAGAVQGQYDLSWVRSHPW